MVGIAQLARAPDCGSGGRRFEPDYPPHIFAEVILLTAAFLIYKNNFKLNIGVSPSGKARDFDSLIRWFESSHPCQINLDDLILYISPAPLAQ